MEKGCWIRRRPNTDWAEHRRKLCRYAIPQVEGVWPPFVHHDCIHNQLVGARNRVCGEAPAIKIDILRELRPVSRRVARLLGRTEPQGARDFYRAYSGAKRVMYEQACDSLEKSPVTPKDAKVRMFVKMERTNPYRKVNPDPRIIQARSPRYVASLAKFLKPIEHRFYPLVYEGARMPEGRVCGKGLCQLERARLVDKYFHQIPHCTCLGIDVVRFDRTVLPPKLALEHATYLRCCNHPELQRLLSWQIKNRCYSAKGLSYNTLGKRMSGDLNTALGNCILMTMFVIYALDVDPYIPYLLLVDGDDCLVFVESKYAKLIRARIQAGFDKLGMELKWECVADRVADIKWCQTRMVNTVLGWNLVRDPLKVLSTTLTGPKFRSSNRGVARLMSDVGMCLLALNQGVPVLQAYAVALMRNAARVSQRPRASLSRRQRSSRQRVLYPGSSSLKYQYEMLLKRTGRKPGSHRPMEITTDARVTFAEAYDISPAQQLCIEEQLRNWDVVFGEPAHKSGDILPGWDVWPTVEEVY